jgi:nicotinate-nucleotide adenylyltransferase
MADHTDLDQVWMVVTPQNPLKDKSTLLKDAHRLNIVREAIEDNDKLRASDIEFHLQKPNYTISTLTHLQEKYPQHTFSLIMGEDNLRTFHKWYNHEVILANHMIYVYPRVLTSSEEAEVIAQKGTMDHPYRNSEKVIFCDDAPIMKVSASFIRQSIKEGKDVRYLLTEPVYKYIMDMHFYK